MLARLHSLCTLCIAILCWSHPANAAPAPSKAQWNQAQMTLIASAFRGTFPKLQGKTVADTKPTFPAQFYGEVNLVKLGFVRKHQKVAESWDPFLQKMQQRYPGLDAVTMPILGTFSGLFGYFIMRGMRKAIKTRKEQLRMVLMFHRKEIFRRSLRLGNTKRMALVLTDRKGRIFWRSSGPYTAAKGRSLQATLTKMTTPTLPSAPPADRPDTRQPSAATNTPSRPAPPARR